MRKFVLAATTAAVMLVPQVSNAFACGGLVAPNGSVRLSRATTFVAFHNGVEHYMTSFAYEGDVTNLGWIVPLPAVPTSIQEGGAWTLQRLEREVAPPPPPDALFARAGAGAASAQVIERTQVEALDITVIKGSGQEILQWCRDNGFALPSDTADHLLKYAKGSPIFMAAKYDVSRAHARRQLSGDGAPVLITMPLKHLWVPLEVLANDGNPVTADLFLLTDKQLNTGQESLLDSSSDGDQLQGAPGFTLVKQEPMGALLYHDLSTDRNMSWVPRNAYLTYLKLNAQSETVTYDLAVTGSNRIQLVNFGTAPSVAATEASPARFAPIGLVVSIVQLAILFGLLVFIVMVAHIREQRRAWMQPVRPT